MSDFELTKTRMMQGIWEGVLIPKGGATDIPDIRVTHLEQEITGIELEVNTEVGHWILRIPVPLDTISDGVQTFLIADAKDNEKLGHFSLIAGEALGDDIRAEMDLLRAELDMLKRAFRRHCLETT